MHSPDAYIEDVSFDVGDVIIPSGKGPAFKILRVSRPESGPDDFVTVRQIEKQTT